MRDWRDDIDRALTQHGLNFDGLRQHAGSGTLLEAWFDNPETPPTAAIYLALSDLTDIEVEVLTGEVDPASTLAVAMRSRGQTAPPELLQRSTRLLRAARAVLRLEPYTDRLRRLQGLQRLFSTSVTSSWDARQKGKTAALQLRAHVGLDTEPVLDLPGLIEDLGVAIEFTTTLPKGMHGVTSWTLTHDGWVATIAVNANDYWTVQRYSLAHEFCHVLHQDRPQDLTTEYKDDLRIASDPSEARAEAFASHLLAPRAGVGNHWRQAGLGAMPDGIAVANMMWRWGMSRQALCIALEDCPTVAWNKSQTEGVASLNHSQMIRDAGLENEWATMAATERAAEPSAWLTEATAELFLSSRLPVENYAVVTDQDPGTAARQLLVLD